MSSQPIPCEICNQMVEFDTYTEHIQQCMRNTRITGFFIRQQRNMMHQSYSDDSDDESSDEEEQREAQSNANLNTELSTFRGYFNRNSQVSRMTLQSFLQEHFSASTSSASPPTRQVIWFNIASSPASTTGTSPSMYDLNVRISELLGKVETGLTEEQLKEVCVSTSNAEELKLEADDLCAICQETLLEVTKKNEQVCMLACHHKYCDGCIKTWLQKSKKCPVCMVDLEDAYLWGR